MIGGANRCPGSSPQSCSITMSERKGLEESRLMRSAMVGSIVVEPTKRRSNTEG
jgi:hypothetical protein